MVWKKDGHAYTWDDLEGKVAPEVLCAPRTGNDLTGTWPKVHARVLGYLMRNVRGKPWIDHLALIAAVMTAQRRDAWTVEATLKMLHPRFSSLFPLFTLDSMSQSTIEPHLVSYLRGEVLAQDTLATLDNQEARNYYEQHRSWQGPSRKRAKPLVVASSTSPGTVKPGRDEQRVRQRYLRMSKEALVVRLITVERTLAEQRDRWLSQQDEALTWKLRAETAERHLQESKEKSSQRKK